MKKHKSFKDELRKSLISHAVFPCVLSIILLIAAVGFISLNLIVRRCNETGKSFSQEIERNISIYSRKASDISDMLSVDRFVSDTGYRVSGISEIYRFLNRQDIRGAFWLFGPELEFIFSTNSDDAERDYILNYLSAQRSNPEFWDKAVFMYDNWRLDSGTPYSCIIFKEISDGKDITGYCGFSLPADRFKTDTARDISLIVTNRFDRVFLENNESFSDDRGKLYNQVKREEGFFKIGGRSFYTESFSLYGGDIKVYAVAACNTYIFLILISSATAILIALLMCYSIYISAGRIAKKKTDIMYELTSALSEVEKGNLDVKLDINSGDEFEMMGNSFNVMLGSIRHLIKRHEYLARENTLAAVQVLETQFNPHFLFNTLESIRYMIKLDPKASEKMIVDLSRLLRYSISRDEQKSSLREEIEFAERYLNIMLFRFSDKIRYTMETDEELLSNEVPRMILQPVVENAIKYGQKDGSILNISIKVYSLQDRVYINISDDGCGIDETLLSELKENMAHRHNHSEHIGLYNVHKRISLIYGDDYGADIVSLKGKGTSVMLTVPRKNYIKAADNSGQEVF